MTTTDTTTTELAADPTAVVDTYVRCFNETDPGRRLELAQAVWSAEGRLVDPLVDATGPAAISDAIGALQAQMPGHTLVRTSAVDVHHDAARFTWAVTGPDGSTAVAGHDLVLLAADGRLATTVGFFGDLQPLG